MTSIGKPPTPLDHEVQFFSDCCAPFVGLGRVEPRAAPDQHVVEQDALEISSAGIGIPREM